MRLVLATFAILLLGSSVNAEVCRTVGTRYSDVSKMTCYLRVNGHDTPYSVGFSSEYSYQSCEYNNQEDTHECNIKISHVLTHRYNLHPKPDDPDATAFNADWPEIYDVGKPEKGNCNSYEKAKLPDLDKRYNVIVLQDRINKEGCSIGEGHYPGMGHN